MNGPRAYRPTEGHRPGGRVIGCFLALLVAAAPVVAAPPQSRLVPERMLIVAIAEKPDAPPSVGSTPRGYGRLPTYGGSLRSIAGAARLAKEYGLREVSAWTIRSLQLRCMLYELPAGADHPAMLARLRDDDRVRLVQPLQRFDTLTSPSADAMPDTAATATRYNDPYIGLQRGFAAIGADQAQRWSSGAGVRIAVIDSGIDVGHPDLRGRITLMRDFVGDADAAPAKDRHGTQVAGVIAAVANNRIGIAGIAPDARLYAYRACWSAADGAAARCNSFTLALALDAAIDAGARIINLSLGGPADPLLEQLVRQAIARGAIVVGAVPGSGHLDGFPLNVPSVVGRRRRCCAGFGANAERAGPGHPDARTRRPLRLRVRQLAGGGPRQRIDRPAAAARSEPARRRRDPAPRPSGRRGGVDQRLRRGAGLAGHRGSLP